MYEERIGYTKHQMIMPSWVEGRSIYSSCHCTAVLTRNILQLVQRAEVDEEEGRLVMPSVKPDDAGDH